MAESSSELRGNLPLGLIEVNKSEAKKNRAELKEKNPNNIFNVEMEKLNAEDRKINFKLKYATEHLPKFESLKQLSNLEGTEYNLTLKGIYYSLVGITLREHKIRAGNVKVDSRLNLTIPLPSGQGKKNIKTCMYKILKELQYTVDIPLSLHPQQLIGKVINRGKPMKPNWIKNEGYLSRDGLFFDEAFKLFTSKDEEMQESRRAIRIAKDLIGENLVEKKQVDNTFDEAEKLSYFPKVTIIQFLQPKNLPSDVVEEGDLRRDLVLYNKSISGRDKSLDYENRLKKEPDNTKNLTDFTNFLKENEKLRQCEFEFDENAINKIRELHLALVNYGLSRSQKEANFTNMIDWTLQDFLVKMSCCVGAMYQKLNITEQMVELAFMDLMEFFNAQLDFVKVKINGQLDYGDSWDGARESDQECLSYLWEAGAKNGNDNISINQFKKQIATIKGISYDETNNGGEAVKHYQRFKKNNWIDSKQIGQHDSAVWITFEPKNTNLLYKTDKGGKGCLSYNQIHFELNDKILSVKGNNPNNPEMFKMEDSKYDCFTA